MHVDVQIDRKKHAEIKYLLSLAGCNFAEVAKSIGRHPSTVSSVSLGRSRSGPVEKALADTLNMPVAELFPDRYPQNGDSS